MIFPGESWAGIKRRAISGEAEAQHLYGFALLCDGEHRDILEGRMWLEKAVEQGHADAMYELANSFSGFDTTKSFDLLTKAGEMGSRNAQKELGNRYYWGEGIPEDRSKAMEWYKRAAEGGEGDSHANEMLGMFYEEGVGVEQDWRQAAQHYKAAMAGYYKRYQKALISMREVRSWED